MKYALSNILVILIYPIGIPALFFYILWRNRGRLQAPHIRLQYGFLYDAYTEQMWWFELMDMFNKLFLTSILAFFPSTAQIQVGMVWIVIYIMIILIMQPYLRKGDDRLALICQCALFVLMLMALILTSPQKDYDATTDTLLSTLCIGITIFFVMCFIFQTTNVIRKIWYRRALERLKQQEKRLDPADELEAYKDEQVDPGRKISLDSNPPQSNDIQYEVLSSSTGESPLIGSTEGTVDVPKSVL